MTKTCTCGPIKHMLGMGHDDRCPRFPEYPRAEFADASSKLTFDQLRAQSVPRCEESFHPLFDWSAGDWTTKMTEELGEVAEIAGDMKRGTLGHEEAIKLLGHELADVVMVADLFAARYGIDLGEVVREKFNIVSERPHVNSKRRL